MSELLRHRHTVEQYGVRVEISTEAHKVSHSSTRSSLTGHSWPCFESNDSCRVSICSLHAPHHCPAKLPTPPWEEQTLYRSCSG